MVLLSSCGSPAESASASSVSGSPEAFGVEIASTIEYAAETTGVTVIASAEETEEAQESDTALYEAAISAAVRCDYGESLPYDPTDPMYFWRAMGYFIGSIGESDKITYKDGAYTVSETDIPQLAQVLFGDFDGTIPSVTEEDPLVSLGEDGTYVIHLPDLEDLGLTLSEPIPQEDGTFLVTVSLSDGTAYTAVLRDNCLIGLTKD
jgi:predicted  nucleic acid-binding Zn-ribbon protein